MPGWRAGIDECRDLFPGKGGRSGEAAGIFEGRDTRRGFHGATVDDDCPRQPEAHRGCRHGRGDALRIRGVPLDGSYAGWG